MTTIKKNVKQKETTIPGIILMSAAVIIWLASFFFPLARQVNDMYLLLAFLIGAVLVIAPNRLIGLVDKRLGK